MKTKACNKCKEEQEKGKKKIIIPKGNLKIPKLQFKGK